MRIIVKLKWVDETNTWHLLMPDEKENFLYDLCPNCQRIMNCNNMQKLFDNPNKNRKELYVLDIHRLNDK